MSKVQVPGRARPKTPPRYRRRTPGEARAEIMHAAEAFLRDRPFRELSVRELMEATTLSRPSFYQYFHDLHELLEALLHSVEQAMRQVATPWVLGEGEPIASLRSSLGAVVRLACEHGPILRAVSEAAPMDARLERAWSAFLERWDEVIARRIEIQQAEGLVPADLDARRTAHALNRMDACVFVESFGRRPPQDPEIVTGTLARVWLGTLYGHGAAID